MNHIKTYAIWFLVLVYVSGAIGFVMNPSFFLPFTPYTLLLTCLIFLLYQPYHNRSFAIAFVSIAGIGFLAEVLGVYSGQVFGVYHYGNALGSKLFGVPLVISLNWALLITAASGLVIKLTTNRWLFSLCVSAVVTGIDVLIEQVAPRIDFWYFSEGMAGIHNYIGWMVVSFIASFIFFKQLKHSHTLVGLTVLALQLFFFTLINLFYK